MISIALPTVSRVAAAIRINREIINPIPIHDFESAQSSPESPIGKFKNLDLTCTSLGVVGSFSSRDKAQNRTYDLICRYSYNSDARLADINPGETR